MCTAQRTYYQAAQVYEAFGRSNLTSKWASFISSLPHWFEGPLEYGPAEMRQLDGLLAARAVRDRRRTVAMQFSTVSKELAEAFPDLFPRSLLTFQRWRWAHSALRSRSHSVGIKDERGEWQRTMCLVPGADLLNMAEPSGTTRPSVECSSRAEGAAWGIEGVFVCTTTVDLPAGAELLTEYLMDSQRRDSQRLLLDYGFVPLGANPFDSAALFMPPAATATEAAVIEVSTRVYLCGHE